MRLLERFAKGERERIHGILVGFYGDTLKFVSETSHGINQVVSFGVQGDFGEGRRGQEIFRVLLTAARIFGQGRIEYTGRIEEATAERLELLSRYWAIQQRCTPRPGEEPRAEERRAPRVPRVFQVMSKDLRTFKAVSLDLSATGMRLDAQEELPVGKDLELDMDFDDFRFPRVKAQAEVVWCRPVDHGRWHVGVRFTSVSPHARMVMDAFLKFLEKR